MDTIFKNALLEQNEVPEAILVSVFPKGEDPSDREASLAELERLLETAGGLLPSWCSIRIIRKTPPISAAERCRNWRIFAKPAEWNW